MKHKILRFSVPFAASLLLFTSCTEDLKYDYEGESSYNSEEVDVNFEITAADLGLNTRDGGTAGKQTISKGAKIDLLIYAVYLQTDNKDEEGNITGQTYSLLTQYGHKYVGSIVDTSDDDKSDDDKNDEDKSADSHTNIDWDNPCFHIDENTPALKGTINADKTLQASRDGQSIIHLAKRGTKQEDFDGFFNKEGNSVKLSLRVKKNEKYVFVFWAQSSQTDAYDTGTPLIEEATKVVQKDALRKVRVNYNEAIANDENRDAFCKADFLSVGTQQLLTTRTVKLTRPLAQVNIATTGADFKLMLTGDNTYTNKEYKYSKIKLYGVANEIDLLSNEITTVLDDPNYDVEGEGSEKYITATFDWGKMPALWHLDIDQLIKDFNDENITKEEYNNILLGGENLTGNVDKNKKEEFLYVDLDDKSGYKAYKTEYPTYKDNEFLTETFKYLTMCYVLVPSTQTTISNDNKEIFTSAVLKKIEAAFAETSEGKNYVRGNGDGKITGTTDAGLYELITQVPVQRNWRTNIIGGMGENYNANSIFYSNWVKPSLVTAFDDNAGNPTVVWGEKSL